MRTRGTFWQDQEPVTMNPTSAPLWILSIRKYSGCTNTSWYEIDRSSYDQTVRNILYQSIAAEAAPAPQKQPKTQEEQAGC